MDRLDERKEDFGCSAEHAGPGPRANRRAGAAAGDPPGHRPAPLPRRRRVLRRDGRQVARRAAGGGRAGRRRGAAAERHRQARAGRRRAHGGHHRRQAVRPRRVAAQRGGGVEGGGGCCCCCLRALPRRLESGAARGAGAHRRCRLPLERASDYSFRSERQARYCGLHLALQLQCAMLCLVLQRAMRCGLWGVLRRRKIKFLYSQPRYLRCGSCLCVATPCSR